MSENTSFWQRDSVKSLLASVISILIGLIAGAIFRRHNYIRNFKMCKKGALIGLGVFAAILALFGLILLYAGH